jgi:hypothetical protein
MFPIAALGWMELLSVALVAAVVSGAVVLVARGRR